MEHLYQAFTHIDKAFSSPKHLFDRKIAFNPDVRPTKVVHVFDLDDVQSFFMAPMEVDELDPRLQSCTIRCPNLYVKPMTEKLSRQINDAIANSWRVDLYKDIKAAAPEESGLSHGLTQEESHWLKMLMKGPVLRSRARASEDAAYMTSLKLSSTHLRDYVRRLPEPLTTKQFNQELDAFFGSESGTNGQDAEVGVHALNDADDICLIETNRTSPPTDLQMSPVDYNVSTSPFSLAVEQNSVRHAEHRADEMNLEGTFEIAQISDVGDDIFRSRDEVQRPSNAAEAVSPQAPQALHNESDMYDEEPEYEPPESFDILWPPYQDYTSGPFRVDNIDTFLHTAPEAEISAHQTSQPEFWQGGFEPAMFSLSNSDQPIDCVRAGENIVPNINLNADLQLETELNASANEDNTGSPGPYTKLLRFTNDDDSPITPEMHGPEMKTQELALGEPIFTSTKTKKVPTFHRTRTPSPLKPTRPLAPAPPTTDNPTTTAFTIPIPLTSPTPEPLPCYHPCHSTCIPTSTPTNPPPLTPQSKTVKAVFASPKLRSGPPSPIKITNLDRDSPTKAARRQTHTDPACQATARALDGGGIVHVQLSALGQGLGLRLGLGLGSELGSTQTQPDSAIDVSFPAGAKAEDEARTVSVAVAEASTKTKMKTNAKAKATTATKESEMAMATTTVKRKVGRPRKVRPAVDDGSGGGRGCGNGGGGGGGGGEKVGGGARSPVRKRARKGADGPVGGGAT